MLPYAILFISALWFVVFALRRAVRATKSRRTKGGWDDDAKKDQRKEQWVRHDGIERDEVAHQYLLKTNSAYRIAAEGQQLKREASHPQWEYQITYQDERGAVILKRIRRVAFTSERNPHITAIGEGSEEEIELRASQILACVNLHSGRAIKDFGAYLKRQ